MLTNQKHHLVILFNEDYSKNIPVMERLYRPRFSQISYIVPDHYAWLQRWYRYPGRNFRLANYSDICISFLRRQMGCRNPHELEALANYENAIRIAGFKYYFQNFFWQARHHLLESKADWFWFVADDLLLNRNIDENNILDFFAVSERSKAVICEPYFRSDEWVNWFQGSSDSVIKKLRRKQAYAQDYGSWQVPDDPHNQGPNQHRILANCADFFACHRDVLAQALKAFHILALSKVFVEIAIPNVLLSLDPAATMINNFEWEFDEGRGNVDKIRQFIASNEQKAFYHPVKFSLLDPVLIEEIIPMEKQS